MLFPNRTFISFDLVDAAGILFFSHVFTLAHHVFESSVVPHLGISWQEWFNNGEWIAPIKQSEAVYQKPLLCGQTYDVDVSVKRIGETSFTMCYRFSQHNEEYCSVTLVHVFCNRLSGKKMAIPHNIREKLESL